MTKKKIGFYYILFKVGDLEISAWDPMLKICNYLISLDRLDRKIDLNNNKFGFVDYFSREENSAKILFKCAKHSYRAPLLDRNTIAERENPKTMDEGEQMKTHVYIKNISDSLIALIECGNNLMTEKNIIDYLNFGLNLYNANIINEDGKINGNFSIEMMARDDFKEVLDKMNRATCAHIFYDKNILGSSPMLDFAHPSESIKDNLKLEIKAEKNKSIKDYVYKILDKLNNTQDHITRVRITGKTANNNETIIDTNFIIKKEYIEVSRNEDTGEFNTLEMFSSLKNLANQF